MLINENKKYTSTNILSNSYFMYKDPLDKENPPEIKIDLNNIRNLEVNNNMPLKLHANHVSIKNLETEEGDSAFDKADREVELFINRQINKRKKFVEGSIKIDNELEKRKQEALEKEEIDKANLEHQLVGLIHDSLKFVKKNTPMLAMMPQKFTDAINHLKKEKGIKKNNLLNTSEASLNLSFKSSTSTRSVQRYESNAFLKALGLDLNNLAPGNIKINIDQAKEFIDKWRVKDKSKINEVIRYKVVNEIMNVEERRSVQKLAKLSKKYKTFIENQKEVKKISNQSIDKRDADISSISAINNKVIATGTNSKDISAVFEAVENNKDKTKSAINKSNISSTKLTTTKETESALNRNEFWRKEKIGQKAESIKNSKERNVEMVERPKASSRQREKKPPITSSYSKKKDRGRDRSMKTAEPKKKIKLNAFLQADRICNYINSKPELKLNDNLNKHFNQLRRNKDLENITNRLLRKNRLDCRNYTDTEQSK